MEKRPRKSIEVSNLLRNMMVKSRRSVASRITKSEFEKKKQMDKKEQEKLDKIGRDAQYNCNCNVCEGCTVNIK
jgi:ribosomal protein S7